MGLKSRPSTVQCSVGPPGVVWCNELGTCDPTPQRRLEVIPEEWLQAHIQTHTHTKWWHRVAKQRGKDSCQKNYGFLVLPLFDYSSDNSPSESIWGQPFLRGTHTHTHTRTYTHTYAHTHIHTLTLTHTHTRYTWESVWERPSLACERVTHTFTHIYCVDLTKSLQLIEYHCILIVIGRFLQTRPITYNQWLLCEKRHAYMLSTSSTKFVTHWISLHSVKVRQDS